VNGVQQVDWKQVLLAIEPYPRQHFGLKLIAVGLALALWASLHTGEQSLIPMESSPVELLNVPPNLALSSEVPETLDVILKGRQARMGTVSSTDIQVRIDLSDAHAGTNLVTMGPDNVSVPADFELDRVQPAQLQIVLEEEVEAVLPVVSVIEGEPEAGHEVTSRRLDPDSASIRGPRSRVQQVEQLRTEAINITGRTESFSQQVALQVDSPFVELSEEREVQLTVEIREVPEVRDFQGLEVEVLNSPYRVQVNPDIIGVRLRGPPSVLDDLTVEDLRAVIDAEDLEPRAEDYLIAPQIRFEAANLDEALELVEINPQRRLNVHVYDTPGEAPE